MAIIWRNDWKGGVEIALRRKIISTRSNFRNFNSREDEGVEESCDLDARIGKQDQFFLFFAKREPILSRLAEIAPSLFTLWQLLHNHY